MRARPSVSYAVDAKPDEVFERFRSALEDAECPCKGSVGRKEVTLRICDRLRRIWSPWLLLGVRAEGEGCVLFGSMGPQPDMWTAFVFVYSVLVAVFVAGSMYGFVQLTLQDSPTGLLAAGAALVGLGGACGLDLTGRRLGQGQMGIIRGFVTRTIPEAREID
ncbi:MAG: hypothetical protein H6737_05150 [Alphaproteobacteria bacterium]|nr:hypothetical protein [Alphaproteobacteria bacterium]